MNSAPQAATRDETRVSVATGPLVGPVLRRVVGMLAARADLPLDRLDDAVLVADVIATRASAYSMGNAVTVAVATAPRALELRVGPLRAGGADDLISDSLIPDVGNVIERLADTIDVAHEDGHEYLLLSLVYAG